MARPTSALIVDDEAHVRVYLRMLLQSLGVKTFWEAGDGLQAIALYKEHLPGVVLLDVNMPVMTGREVMEEFQHLNPRAAVVVVTSQHGLQSVQDFRRLGAVGYVLKHTPTAQTKVLLETALDLIAEAESENETEEA